MHRIIQKSVRGAALVVLGMWANAQTVPPENKITGEQPLGFISGTILDQTGAVAIGAHARLTRIGQSPSQEVVSGSSLSPMSLLDRFTLRSRRQALPPKYSRES